MCTVRICTAAASESSRRLRSTTVSRLASSRRLRSQALNVVRPELSLQRGLVQRLGDVPQVGEQPLAADPAEQPFLQPLGQRHRLEQRRDPALVEHPDPGPYQKS